MNCPKCGVEVVGQSLFCHRCGAPLDAGGTEEAATEAVQDALTGRGQPQRDDPELELWQGGYSPKAMIGAWVGAGLATIGGIAAGVAFTLSLPVVLIALVVMWVGLGLYLAYRVLSVSYRLTSQRFFHKRGLLSRETNRIEVIDMDDITYIQGPVERLLGVGSIKVTSSDLTHPVFWLIGIDGVQKVAGMIDDARRAERMRRGVRIEAH